MKLKKSVKKSKQSNYFLIALFLACKSGYNVRKFWNTSRFIFLLYQRWTTESISFLASQQVEKGKQPSKVYFGLLDNIQRTPALSLVSGIKSEQSSLIKLNYAEQKGDFLEIVRLVNELKRIPAEEEMKSEFFGFHLIDGTFTSAFGHMGHGLEMLKFQKDLGAFGSNRLVMVEGDVANAYYLKQWSRVIDIHPMRTFEIEALRALFPGRLIDLEFPVFAGIKYWRFEAYNVSKRLHQESFGETQTLNTKNLDLDYLSTWFKTRGYAEIPPFVVLHVRNKRDNLGRSASNADIKTYIKSINFLIDRGFVVITIGTPNNLSQSMEGFINWSNSEHKDGKIDVLLLALCEFMIGTSSGPLSIPPTFGKRVLYTNNPKPWCSYLYEGFQIPQLVYDRKLKRLLKFSELSKNGLSISTTMHSDSRFMRYFNDDEMIFEGTKSLLENKQSHYNQWQFNSYNPLAIESNGMKILPDFLDRYEQLLD